MLNVKKHHQIVDSLIFAVDTVLFNCVLKIPEFFSQFILNYSWLCPSVSEYVNKSVCPIKIQINN